MMIVEVLGPIMDRIAAKAHDVLCSGWGWAMSLVAFTVSLFAPVWYAFFAIGVGIGLDMVFGIVSAKMRKKFILSQLLRDTEGKILVYVGCLVMVFVAENFFPPDDFLFTKGVAALGCVCEIWSMLGHALVIAPGMPFPRLLKMQLRGEVESKLGKSVGTILDKEENDENGSKGDKE